MDPTLLSAGATLSLPPGLSGHKFIYNKWECCFYLVGGWQQISHDENHNYYPKVWRYNPTANSWSQIVQSNPKSAPVSMCSHCAHFTGPQTLLHFGGSLSIKRIRGNSVDVTMFCLATKEWTEPLSISGNVFPEQYCGHWFGQASALSPCGTKLFVATGVKQLEHDQPDYLQMFQLHLQQNSTWTDLTTGSSSATDEAQSKGSADEPIECRIRHEIALHEGNVYVFGGAPDSVGYAGLTFTLSSLPCFNLATRRWNTVETYPDSLHGHPKSRTCFGFCKWGKDSAFISGGCHVSEDTDEREILDDLWRFNFPTSSWQMINWKLPIPVWFHSMDMANWGELIIFGGCPDTSYVVRTPAVQRAKVAVGSLKALSLKTLLVNYESLAESDKETVKILTHFSGV